MRENINIKRSSEDYIDKDLEIADKTRPAMSQSGVSMSIDTDNYINRRKQIDVVQQAETGVQKKLQEKDIISSKFLTSKFDLIDDDNGKLKGQVDVPVEFVLGKESRMGTFMVKVSEGQPQIDSVEFDKQIVSAKPIEPINTEDTLEKAIDEAAAYFTKEQTNKKASISDFDSQDDFASVPVGDAPRSFLKQKNICPSHYSVGSEVNLNGVEYAITAEDAGKSSWIFSIKNP